MRDSNTLNLNKVAFQFAALGRGVLCIYHLCKYIFCFTRTAEVILVGSKVIFL